MDNLREDTALEAALLHLIDAAGNFDRHDEALDADEDLLTKGIERLERLRKWRARAEPLLRALTEHAMRPDMPDYCAYCSSSDQHMPDCPVTLAKALLAESEASK